MTKIKMHIFKAKLPFYPPCKVKCRLQNKVSTQRQHQLTRGKFFLTRLSIVRIPPLAGVYKKKATILGTLTHQMLFQGKDTNGAASNEK